MADPLVLIPGMMCDARIYAAQIEALSRETSVMVVPPPRGDRIEEIASDILSQAPRRFAVAGQDLGGAIAMELLRRAPERVTRIALMATTPLPDTPPAAAERETLIIKARTGRLEEAMRDFIIAAGLAPGAARLDLAAAYGGMAAELGPDIYVRQARALQRRRDQQSTLARCSVPALILCGAHDQLCPVKRHTFMAEMTPGARLVVLDDAGHLPSVEAPEAVCAALRDWLGLPFVLR